MISTNSSRTFFFAKERIVEFVPENKSQDPRFQDDFTYFSHQLQTLHHPGLLKLLDYGHHETRLFRAWERRRLFAASFDVYPTHEIRRRLLDLVETLQLLWSAGIPIEAYRMALISSDDKGFFIARHPFTAKEPPLTPTYATALSLNLLWPSPDFTPRNQFLLDLGTFVSVTFFKKFPYEEPPIVYFRHRTKPRRTKIETDSPVWPVVHRLTDLNPQSSFLDLDEALGTLKTALLEA